MAAGGAAAVLRALPGFFSSQKPFSVFCAQGEHIGVETFSTQVLFQDLPLLPTVFPEDAVRCLLATLSSGHFAELQRYPRQMASASVAHAAAEAEEKAVYTGERKNGRMEGYGTYRFPSGTVYTGDFLDGEFHGEGTLQFADGCGKYHARWEHGKAIKGRYVFADGLAYTEPTDGEWTYCRGDGDRRFYSELVEGLRPAGDSQLSNTHPPPIIPAGSYDVGDGFLFEDGKVYDYLTEPGSTPIGEPRRTASQDEEAWAKANCRRGQ